MLRLFLLFLLCSLWLAQPAGAQQPDTAVVPGDEQWDARFGYGGIVLDGVSGVEAQVVLPNGDLVVGGRFEDAGGEPLADNIARWDGQRWHPLGQGLTRGAGVMELAVSPEGELVAGGWFTLTGGYRDEYRYHLARWDGRSWRELPAPQHDNELGQLVAGPGGRLAILGDSAGPTYQQTWSSVFWWDGQRWQKFQAGRASLAGYINALVISPVGDLYIGGGQERDTLHAGSGFLARWDGTRWQAIGLGFNGPVRALVPTPADGLYVGGAFTDAIGLELADYLVRWDGTRWTPVGKGLKAPLNKLERMPGGHLIAVTNRGGLGSDFSDDLVRWDGRRWQRLNTGFDGEVSSLVARPNDELFVAGHGHTIPLPNGQDVEFACWDGRQWVVPLVSGLTRQGIDGQVNIIASVDNGVVIKGFFSTAGGTTLRLARWAESGWQPVGRNRNPGSFGPALAVTPAGDVLVDGVNSQHSSSLLSRVMRWDGRRWRPMGRVIAGGINVLAPTADGAVLLGGWFALAKGEEEAHRVARWDGRQWQPLAEKLPGNVRALVRLPTGDVLAAGRIMVDGFDRDRGYVMRWDGRRWQMLGDSLPGPAGALLVLPGGDVLVGGGYLVEKTGGSAFPPAEGSTGYLSRWTGGGWEPVGGVFNGPVEAVAQAHNGDLVVGGVFTDAGRNPYADCLARWDGRRWHAFGSGLNGAVQALAVTSKGDVYVGGWFTATGSGCKAISHFGIYHAPDLRGR